MSCVYFYIYLTPPPPICARHLWFDHQSSIWWWIQVMKLPIIQFSLVSCYFLHLGPTVFLSALFLIALVDIALRLVVQHHMFLSTLVHGVTLQKNKIWLLYELKFTPYSWVPQYMVMLVASSCLAETINSFFFQYCITLVGLFLNK